MLSQAVLRCGPQNVHRHRVASHELHLTDRLPSEQVQAVNALDYYRLPASESAIRLLCMISAHESGDFHYVQQLRGPALSLFQIEPATFTDLCHYAKKRHFSINIELPSSPWRLVFDQRFAAAMARIFFLRFNEPIPDDLHAMADYAKQYWNTYLGKATAQQYFNAYSKHFKEK